MRLTETEFKASALEIREKNCTICIHGWCEPLKIYKIDGETVTISALRLCKQGLTFPKCRGLAKGFKVSNG